MVDVVDGVFGCKALMWLVMDLCLWVFAFCVGCRGFEVVVGVGDAGIRSSVES